MTFIKLTSQWGFGFLAHKFYIDLNIVCNEQERKIKYLFNMHQTYRFDDTLLLEQLFCSVHWVVISHEC